MEDIELLFKISKENYQMVMKNEAKISSGGIRNLNGTLLELAKPVYKSIKSDSINTFASGALGINTFSSLANNVQSAQIQRSVNIANKKLDLLLSSSSDIYKEIRKVSSSLHSLSWFNIALSYTGIYITIEAFNKIQSNIDDINNNILQFGKIISNKLSDDFMNEYNNIFLNLRTCIDYLKIFFTKGKIKDDCYLSIGKEINNAYRFISDCYNCIIGKSSPKSNHIEVYCLILYNLLPLYIYTLKEYHAQYFYNYKSSYSNYSTQRDIVYKMCDIEFLKKFHIILLSNNPSVDIGEKEFFYHCFLDLLDSGTNNLIFNEYIIKQIDSNRYRTLEKIISNYLWEEQAIKYEDSDYYYFQIPELNRISTI